ncbi:ABC-F family ATP-binding cassette domain-containing protein [Olivibacter sp. SDN3]|uniref:ABC-F family ATP-binding cassette domain-containing protein n=1 Tax=Olivibacter sp. SDN3 TaxID=2764720 RepID=UPI001650FDBC|nr:ABC-F family ATP-binding cassette domain-containing protein [Olivibacter sp. SDN3]QNL51115.1 ABC-F family ATP-binding cassette domain-containing protein [Olivibacter sp. SDN3]
MSILSTEQIGHTFGDKWLFKNLTFGLQKGDRTALVGVNGTGKSTLLKILAGKIIPLEGKTVSTRDIKIGYLEQEPDFTALEKIEDFIYSLDNETQQLIKQYEALIDTPNHDQHLLTRLIEELTVKDAWSYEDSIKIILNRLGITDLKQSIKSLSGGQRKRLSLAKLLIDDPDIYILDEPTNHLDLETIEWLEKILTVGQKTLLLVTHDRYFLDNICTEIKELHNAQLYSYKGNYSNFLEKKAEREASDASTLEKNKNLLRKELEWMRRQPQARGTKSKSRINAFYDLEEKTKNNNNRETIELSVKMSRQGGKILELTDVSVSFGEKKIINNFSYTFKKGDRIGLAGKNGSGKSTFLNLITKALSPIEGTITVGETTVYGYYKQGGLSFSNNERVIDIVKNVAEYITMDNGDTITASQLLTHFLFPPEKQFGFVEKLSGGEKKRLQLMRILMQNPNFLILDEPTNDLDIDTLNVLESFLTNFSGVLILVSHDRYLIDRLTDQLFIFDSGNITIYNGNYTDFKAEERLSSKEKKIQESKKTIQIKQQETARRKISYKERKEFENLDQEITSLEKKIKIKTDELKKTTHHEELSKLATTIEFLNRELEIKSERWLELGELI